MEGSLGLIESDLLNVEMRKRRTGDAQPLAEVSLLVSRGAGTPPGAPALRS